MKRKSPITRAKMSLARLGDRVPQRVARQLLEVLEGTRKMTPQLERYAQLMRVFREPDLDEYDARQTRRKRRRYSMTRRKRQYAARQPDTRKARKDQQYAARVPKLPEVW